MLYNNICCPLFPMAIGAVLQIIIADLCPIVPEETTNDNHQVTFLGFT